MGKQCRFIDLSGQRFGYLTVLERTGDHVSAGGNRFVQFLCKCDCGNLTKVTAGHLKTGHKRSCGKCGKFDTVRDLTGQKFGRLTVLEQSGFYTYPKSGDRDITWLCQCECGNFVVARGNNLKDGSTRSCGCLRKEYRITDDDMVGKIFGRLTVLSRADDYQNADGSYSNQWNCKCSCGSDVVVRGASLRNGHTESCGCYRTDQLIINGVYSSKAEYWVAQFLDDHGFTYVAQKTYPGLVGVGGNLLVYDFLVHTKDNIDVLIECNGLQHYESVEFFGGDAVFARQKEHDMRKWKYAIEHEIPLFELNCVGKCRPDIERALSQFLGI